MDPHKGLGEAMQAAGQRDDIRYLQQRVAALEAQLSKLEKELLFLDKLVGSLTSRGDR